MLPADKSLTRPIKKRNLRRFTYGDAGFGLGMSHRSNRAGICEKGECGIVCLGLALILGKIGGISDGDIYAGFPYKLFCTLLGTMLFFSLLQQNGTLEKISEKLIGLCGKNTFLVPVIIYVVSFLLSAAGPGAISVQSVTVLFAVSLAVQMDASPVLMGAMAILGAVGGTASPSP